MKIAPLYIIAASALLAVPLLADHARIENYKTQLRNTRPAELPRETAQLVAKGNADVADAVTAAISLNSASAHLVVGSVAKASPKSAGVAAAAAITAQPSLASTITKAAVLAAPAEVSAIVTESCRARPSMFYNIGVAAATAAPKATDKIIPAIIEGVPALKPIIEKAQKDYKAAKRTASLALLLKHSENILLALANDQKVTSEVLLASATEASISARLPSVAVGPPPVQNPPFVPGGTPGEVASTNTVPQDPGTRTYSAP